jgi:hypothetical protein
MSRPIKLVPSAKARRARAGSAAGKAGGALERALAQHHAVALQLGIAEVRHVSPHVLHLGPGKLPGSFSARFDAPGGCDYRGTMRGGRSLVMEAKSTGDNNLGWSAFTSAELADFAAAAELGALGLVVWERRDLAAMFAVPWAEMPWKVTGNGRSVRAEDVEGWRVREAPYLRRFVEARP